MLLTADNRSRGVSVGRLRANKCHVIDVLLRACLAATKDGTDVLSFAFVLCPVLSCPAEKSAGSAG